MQDTPKDIIAFYHANCPDGFGAAWAAWKKFGEKADYFPLSHGEKNDVELEGKEIYFLDIIPSREKVTDLMKTNERVTAIDHHESEEDVIKITEKHSYAVAHSGAVLAWSYFHPHTPVPQLLLHIEDFDLWRFSLPNTEEVEMLLDIVEREFSAWDAFSEDLENEATREKRFGEGALLVKFREKLVKQIAEEAQLVEFEGYKVLASNSRLFHSQVGHILYTERPPLGIVWRVARDGVVRVSLRSDGTADVSELAKKHGGGGHKAASGFLLGRGEPLPWKPAEE